MPKIIPELKERLIKSGRKLLLSGQPKALSLRALSSDCNIAVGTVYNYFTGKDQLIVAVLLDDWEKVLETMRKDVASAKSVRGGLMSIYEDLIKFVGTYKIIWNTFAKGEQKKEGVKARHTDLMNDLGEHISALATKFDKKLSKNDERLICELLVACVLQEDITKDAFVDFASKAIC